MPGCVPVRIKTPEWTEAEDAILEEAAHLLPKQIQRYLKRAGYARSIRAIVSRRHRHGWTTQDPDWVTAHDLAKALGIDTHVPLRWIAQGLLKPRRRETVKGTVSQFHWLHRRDIRRFIVEHVARVDIRKADKFWLVDLLARP